MSTSDPRPENRRRRRGVLFAMLFGLAAFGLVGAAAATLNGLGSQSLGADDTIVGSCDTDGVSLAYTTGYDAPSGQYRVTSVTVNGIATACNGQAMSITLRDSTNAGAGAGTATVTGTSQTVTITPSASAEAVTGAAVVITG